MMKQTRQAVVSYQPRVVVLADTVVWGSVVVG
jgi:hypothetical protein